MEVVGEDSTSSAPSVASGRGEAGPETFGSSTGEALDIRQAVTPKSVPTITDRIRMTRSFTWVSP